MNRTALALITVLTAAPAPALACGGFFCNAVTDPVVQTAERVLFRVNADDTLTSVIEIEFQGGPTAFAWVLPLSDAIDPETISTASAGLFDELEDLMAPTFVSGGDGAYADAAGMSAGCGGPWWWGSEWDGGGEFVEPTFSGVEVVGESVVGPYALEIITAEDSNNLLGWLQWNGYQIPSTAMEPIAHYVSSGMAFLGVKLNPDVPEGPIDALEITMPGSAPMLPLLLTSVAAVEDMDITAYVMADERFAPSNYVDHEFDWSRVEWAGEGRTDYDRRLPSELDAVGGRAFVTEFAGSTRTLGAGDVSAELLASAPYITRFQSVLSPGEMTIDPVWVPAPELGDVDNVHTISAPVATAAAGPWWLLGVLLFGWWRGRR